MSQFRKHLVLILTFTSMVSAFVQEYRSSNASEKLRCHVTIKPMEPQWVITQARKRGISEADNNHFSKTGYNILQSRITRRDRS